MLFVLFHMVTLDQLGTQMVLDIKFGPINSFGEKNDGHFIVQVPVSKQQGSTAICVPERISYSHITQRLS